MYFCKNLPDIDSSDEKYPPDVLSRIKLKRQPQVSEHNRNHFPHGDLSNNRYQSQVSQDHKSNSSVRSKHSECSELKSIGSRKSKSSHISSKSYSQGQDQQNPSTGDCSDEKIADFPGLGFEDFEVSLPWILCLFKLQKIE